MSELREEIYGLAAHEVVPVRDALANQPRAERARDHAAAARAPRAPAPPPDRRGPGPRGPAPPRPLNPPPKGVASCFATSLPPGGADPPGPAGRGGVAAMSD